MRMLRIIGIMTVTALLMSAQQASQTPKRKKILAIGEVQGFQHDSVSHGLASIEKWGRETGLWDTYIRTDSQLITKEKVPAGNAKNLNFFDAVIFYTTGELPLNDEQKKALLSFVHEDGKGFIGVHSATDTFYKWPEYGEMIGGYFDGHPWNTFEAPIFVEDRNFSATKHMPVSFTLRDEIYQFKSWSRDGLRVLMRLNESKLDLTNKNVKRTDHDFAVSWVKPYGKGRVFYSTLGHVEEVYDNPMIKQMYVEGIKWALGLTEGDTKSHAKVALP
ncbi:MAG: ThuA domain-containing protein [Bryobacteraceae bacterium]|nr:ThuA domain-containing protein [Bryobacteraceae bacterium]